MNMLRFNAPIWAILLNEMVISKLTIDFGPTTVASFFLAVAVGSFY